MLTPLPILIIPSQKGYSNKVLQLLFANQPGTYISWSPLFHSLVKKQTHLNISKRKMEQIAIPKKTTGGIKIWHFSCISAVRHIRDRNTSRRKLISTLNVHPEMSVSEAGWAMKGGPKIKKGTWKMISMWSLMLWSHLQRNLFLPRRLITEDKRLSYSVATVEEFILKKRLAHGQYTEDKPEIRYTELSRNDFTLDSQINFEGAIKKTLSLPKWGSVLDKRLILDR